MITSSSKKDSAAVVGVLFPWSPGHEENNRTAKASAIPPTRHSRLRSGWKMLAPSSSRAGGNYALIPFQDSSKPGER